MKGIGPQVSCVVTCHQPNVNENLIKIEGFVWNSIDMHLEFANRLFRIISQIGEAAKKLKQAYSQDTHQNDDLQRIYQILPPPTQDLKTASSSYARDFQPSQSIFYGKVIIPFYYDGC